MRVLLVSFSLILINMTFARAQNPNIQIGFEIDGKKIDCECVMAISIRTQDFLVQSYQKSILIPVDVWNHNEAGVRFVCGKKYRFNFGKIYTPKFKASTWVVGVDNRPFDEELLRGLSVPLKKIKKLHYIKFGGDGGDGTTIVVPIMY